MDTSPEQAYSQLLRQLASPIGIKPETLAESFREVERMHSMGQIEDWQMQNAREAYARTTSKVSDAAHWVLDKAKGTLQSAGGHLLERADTAVVNATKNDPVRAILIAAATGAILMGVVLMLARSGVRTVTRQVKRRIR